MSVTSRTLNKQTFKIEIDPEEKVRDLKKKMKGPTFAAANQKLDYAGKGRHNFPSIESEKVRKAYKMIQMRDAIDTKRFYKKADKVSEFAQIGTVVTDAHDFYDRAKKSELKSTIVEEMLADIATKRKLKKRFKTVKQLVGKAKKKIPKNHKKTSKRKKR